MSNHLGSASLELDSTAAIISYEEYYPFGSSSYRSGRNNAETSLKRYRYVGKERDDETGLYYYGARYYASWLARFVSVDPLKDKYPQLASYQYAGNDPVGDIDIDGLEGTKTTVKSDATAIDPIRTSRVRTELSQQQKKDEIDLKKLLTPRNPKDDPNATFLNPDYRNSFEKEQSKKQLNAYKFDKAYEKFIKEGQQRDPFNFGGREFGMGMSKTLGTATKEGALLVTGDYLFAKGVQVYRHLKHAKHLKKADDVVENVNKIDDFANYGDEISSGERMVPQEYPINAPKGILGNEALTGLDDAAKGAIKNPGPALEGGFDIPQYYTYTTKTGEEIFVTPHAFKHLEELGPNALNKYSPEYTKLLGQTYQKAINTAIEDVMSRGPLKYDYMYQSGGNEIMFGAPRNAVELPAVKHFQ